MPIFWPAELEQMDGGCMVSTVPGVGPYDFEIQDV